METITRLPLFQGKPLIKIPEFIPQIGFLEGDFGEAFFDEYRERARADYGGSRVLGVLRYEKGVVRGSNPFAVVLANQILRQEGLKIATQADLEKALKIGALNLQGLCEDTGLVLRTEEDKIHSKNNPLARNLGSQLEARGIEFSPKNPLMIPLTELELEKTADNIYRLNFKLRKDAELYKAPILAKGGKFNSKDIDEKTGLPRQMRCPGDRRLYTRSSGLSRLCLDGMLGLYSSSWGLAASSGGGRIVVVSAEGTSPKEQGGVQ